MKVYITSRLKGAAGNKADIDTLCTAVRDAGMEDFHFIRDVENYQLGFFESPKQLWTAALKHLSECDALLIDISNSPSGGRVVEAGMAYALKKPVYIIVKSGVEYKDIYDGIATAVLRYDEISDITAQLKSV